MNNQQITSLISTCSIINEHFRGVYAMDTLPKIEDWDKPSSCICNLDRSTEPGSHWISIFYPKNGPPEYFDSYGFDGKRFEFFLGETYYYNPHFLQFPFSVVCGQYCIYYLYKRSFMKSMYEVLKPFKLDDQLYNDFYVNDFIEKHFNVDLKVFDMKFIINQFNISYKQKEYDYK